MEYLNLAQYRTSKSTREDLVWTLMHLQVQFEGDLGLEFRCLGKVFTRLSERRSPLEVEPDNYKFVLSKHSTEWHISTALQSYSFLVKKGSSINFLLQNILAEMQKRDINVLYGVFRDKADQHIVDLFNRQHNCSVTVESYRKYLKGSRFRRIPNRKYQEYSGIDRKTFYKLTNFLDALSPGAWDLCNIDMSRIKGTNAKEIIKGKVLSDCEAGLEMIWQHNLKKSIEYSETVKRRKTLSKALLTTDTEWKLIPLRTLKKRKNRVPILINEYCLHNLVRLVKNRPCPVKPYVDYIRHTRPYRIESRLKLMKSIREAKFSVSQSLKEEGLMLDRIHAEEVIKARRARERVIYSRIKKEKKEAKRLEGLRRAAIRREEIEKKEKAKEEKKQALLAAIKEEELEKMRKAEEEKEQTLLAAQVAATLDEEEKSIKPFIPSLDEPILKKKYKPPKPGPQLNLSSIFGISESRIVDHRTEQEIEEDAHSDAVKALRIEKLIEISKQWKFVTNRMEYLKSARKTLQDIDEDQTYVKTAMGILREATKDQPMGVDLADISRRL